MSQTKQFKRNLRQRFVDKKTAKDDNANINAPPNMPCNFLLFKVSEYLQISFPRKSKL